MAFDVEGVVNGGVDGQETLRRSRRFEPLHLALASPDLLMRVLGPVVLPQALLMAYAKAELASCGAIGSELIGHDDLRRKALFAQQLAHETDRSRCVSPRLHQHVEDLALAVDSTP